MIVGASVVELHIHGCRSLKAKRGVVRSIARRVRNRFNLAVAEVGGQDTWQRAVLGLAAAGSETVEVRKLLDRAHAFIEELHLAEVRNVDVEILDLPHAEGLWDPELPDDEE
ncbi:MAG TPA: DUF503 domain-containing protein [Myxococcota bacterium]